MQPDKDFQLWLCCNGNMLNIHFLEKTTKQKHAHNIAWPAYDEHCCQFGDSAARSGNNPDPLWQLKLSKATSDKSNNFFWSLGKCWHWPQNMSSGGRNHPSPVSKHSGGQSTCQRSSLEPQQTRTAPGLRNEPCPASWTNKTPFLLFYYTFLYKMWV